MINIFLSENISTILTFILEVEKKNEQISMKELPSERLTRLRREVQELKEELQVVIERVIEKENSRKFSV